jgi:tetratricopeptide (TPR) repeat protein
VDRLPGPATRGLFDSARNTLSQQEKYSRDAAVLEEALKTEPENARYAFYLGQSWRDAGQPEKALAAYRRRAAMPGWEEEGWMAQYQAARLLETLGRGAEAVEAYLGSYQRRPSRAEPLCDLARVHRMKKAFQVAYLFAKQATSLAKTDDVLFVDESVYRWRSLDELAIASYWVGRFEESLAASQRLLAEGLFPEDQRERIEANRRFAEERLAVSRRGPSAGAAATTVSKEVWLEHSLFAYQLRRYEEAEACARQVVRLDANNAEAHNNVAAACLALGRYQEAVVAAETAVRLKPDFSMAQNNLSWARQQIRRDGIET